MIRAGDLNGEPHTPGRIHAPVLRTGAREQRELAERVRAAYGSGTLAADFERWAADLERLARPDPRTTRGLTLRGGFNQILSLTPNSGSAGGARDPACLRRG